MVAYLHIFGTTLVCSAEFISGWYRAQFNETDQDLQKSLQKIYYLYHVFVDHTVCNKDVVCR